ncbi:Uncharacterised protein [Mycobacterium tuberculosis]|nr:Uncharacterised protein [Mycobacterium tuberculosis]
MPWQHTEFAVIAAKLGEERDRFLGALRYQFAVHPRHRVDESRALAIHFGGK